MTSFLVNVTDLRATVGQIDEINIELAKVHTLANDGFPDVGLYAKDTKTRPLSAIGDTRSLAFNATANKNALSGLSGRMLDIAADVEKANNLGIELGKLDDQTGPNAVMFIGAEYEALVAANVSKPGDSLTIELDAQGQVLAYKFGNVDLNVGVEAAAKIAVTMTPDGTYEMSVSGKAGTFGTLVPDNGDKAESNRTFTTPEVEARFGSSYQETYVYKFDDLTQVGNGMGDLRTFVTGAPKQPVVQAVVSVANPAVGIIRSEILENRGPTLEETQAATGRLKDWDTKHVSYKTGAGASGSAAAPIGEGEGNVGGGWAAATEVTLNLDRDGTTTLTTGASMSANLKVGLSEKAESELVSSKLTEPLPISYNEELSTSVSGELAIKAEWSDFDTVEKVTLSAEGELGLALTESLTLGEEGASVNASLSGSTTQGLQFTAEIDPEKRDLEQLKAAAKSGDWTGVVESGGVVNVEVDRVESREGTASASFDAKVIKGSVGASIATESVEPVIRWTPAD